MEASSRRVLLFGRTGNGKSTVANVLTRTERFKESEFGVSETKSHQREQVTVDGITYDVIDTIGIGDTNLPIKQVLLRIADACYALRDGFHQVFFVTSGRFTEDEIFAYDLLRSTVFSADVVRFTTIVRTRFAHFQNPQACNQDIELMKRENPDLAEIFSSCRKILHVDNMNPVYGDLALQTRERGHTMLCVHLQGCSELYRPQNLNELNERISKFQTEKEKVEATMTFLENQIRDLNNKAERDKQAWEAEMRNIAAQREEISRLNTQMTAERQKEQERLDQLYKQMMEEQSQARIAAEKQQAEAQERIAAEKAHLAELQNEIANNTGQHVQNKSPSLWRVLTSAAMGAVKTILKPVSNCSIQ